jgi:hypothetical protein
MATGTARSRARQAMTAIGRKSRCPRLRIR